MASQRSSGSREVQVGGDREPAEVRRDMRHELDRVAEVAGDLALVHVAGQRVGHQVVAQLAGSLLSEGVVPAPL